VRLYVRRLPANISGLYAYDDRVGPCILINAAHPRERQTNTGFHEVGHFISTRRAPDALHDGTPETSREERYANTFARAFLMPARAVMAKFKDVTAGASQLTRRHVIMLAQAFGVSREAMVRRLEELRLCKTGTWDWFQANGGITDEQVRQVLGDAFVSFAPQADLHSPVPTRLALLAREVWARELLSEGQLARLLNIDRMELRELLTEFQSERLGNDAQLQIPG
jgi:Zn-dependent peptidase ImmA (M78 family)